MKTIVVVTDLGTGHEALYLDGILNCSGVTIYARDINAVQNGDPICFRHFLVRLPLPVSWPQTLDEALQYEQI